MNLNEGEIGVVEQEGIVTFRCDNVTFLYQSDLADYCEANGKDLVLDAEIKLVRPGIAHAPQTWLGSAS